MPVVYTIKQASSKKSQIPSGGSEKPPVRVSVTSIESMTVGDVIRMYLSLVKKNLNVNRVRLTVEGSNETLSPNEKALSAFPSLKGDTVLIFKDLGPQISWKMVFIVEYLFPMLICPLLWILVRKFPSSLFTKALFGSVASPGPSQATLCWQDSLAFMFTAHFVKRELETMLVHRFGNDTMPLSNIFKNSGYYWLFAFWIAHTSLHPLYTVPACESQRYAGVALFVMSELLNLKAHIDLRNLRPAGTRIRKVPQGILFKFISCPNYFFEILAWVGFTLASQSVAAAAFTFVGAAQMTAWAIQKHKRYLKEFDGIEGRELYPRNRKILVPFLF
jgi:very-long-chain enoyl-CoA reductase